MADQELKVKFSGDTSELEKSLARVRSQLNDLPKSTDTAARSAKGLESANASLGSSFKSMAAGYLTVAAAMQAGQLFLTATKDVQKFENQLKVASGTQQDYAKNTQFLEGLAAKYNKNVIDLGANFAKLTIATRGTNLEGKETERLFSAVTATSAALQMSVDDTNGTFNAFIQMVSKGNVQAEELRGQLGERLYGAFNLAAKAMGVTTQELNKMLEQGQVAADDLLPKLTRELENTFGKDAEKNAHNLGSAIDYAKGQLTLLVAESGKTSGFTDFLTQAAKDAGGLLEKLRLLNKEKGTFAAAGGAAGAFLETLTGGLYTSPALQYARDRQNLWKAPKGVMVADTRMSNTSSENYGAQFDIRESNPKTEEKLKKAREAQANKAITAMNKWVSDEIQASKDRIAEGLLKIAQQPDMTRQYNSDIGAVKQADHRGITTGLDNSLNQTTRFSSDQQEPASFSKITAQIQAMTAAWWEEAKAKRASQKESFDLNAENAEMALSIESVTSEIENRLIGFYGNLSTASEKGWKDLVEKVKSGIMSYDEAMNELRNLTSTQEAGAAMQQAFKEYGSGMVQVAGEFGAAMTGIGGSLDNVGGKFFEITASLFDRLGQSLIVASGVFEAFEIGIKSMNPVVALIGAAAAFGAAAIIRSKAHEDAGNSFWTGGIVSGPGGVDKVPAMLTAGEMVLNKGQQRAMFGILDGTYSGSQFGGASSGGGSGEMVAELHTRVRGGDIDLSGSVGRRRNNYFRSKRR